MQCDRGRDYMQIHKPTSHDPAIILVLPDRKDILVQKVPKTLSEME